MSTAPILDQSALLKQLDGDEDLWREIMDIFFDDTPKQIGALPAAIEDPDPPLVQRLAHTIKGSSGNVGAPALQAAAWQLEQAAESDDLGCAQELLQAIEVEFARAEKAYAEVGVRDPCDA
jgi:HPt (histidine-containing phosphotransfer) domain-containing protein